MSPEQLKQTREAMGQTQEGLAKLLGVARNTVARWERAEIEMPGFLHLALEALQSSEYCPVQHGDAPVRLVVQRFCPACRGAGSSERKSASSRANGALGGRPRKRLDAGGQEAVGESRRVRSRLDAVGPSVAGRHGKVALETEVSE